MNNPQVAVYITWLKDQNSSIRWTATEMLGRIGDASAVPALIEALRDGVWDVRYNAAHALEKVGVPAVSALIEALKDQDSTVRSGAAEALGKIGDASAVPALIEALKDEDSHVRYRAASALGKTSDASTIPALIEALQDGHGDVRSGAASALGGSSDVSAVPTLIEALKDGNENVRSFAASALEKIGDAVALPRKILADSRLTAQERIVALDRLRSVRYKDKHRTLRYEFPDNLALCRTVLDEDDSEARIGAQTVLDRLMLLRPSQRDETTDSQILLRPWEGGTLETQPETLLIAASKSDEGAEHPP